MPPKADPPVTEILLDELDDGIVERVIEVDPADLGFEDEHLALPAPVRVRLKIGRSIETYSLQGAIACSVRGECCRCLEEIEEPLETDFRLLVQRKQASADELEAVVEEEEVAILDPGEKSLDLVAEILEALVLALPLRIYCSTDCKGLCPQCGENLNKNICSCTDEPDDPRWAALKELKFE
jgi:uncharacterized protein